jgi:hypothetical protein
MKKTVCYSKLWNECEITIKRRGKLAWYRKPIDSYVAKEIRRLMLEYRETGYCDNAGNGWTVIGDKK